MDEIFTTEFMDEPDPVSRIMNSKSIKELHLKSDYIFKKINDNYSSVNKEAIVDRVDEIESYIKNHFHEQDISVVTIWEQFQITSSYFSHIFKKHTGTNLPEYPNKLRIEKAKQLLMNTEMNINDIAQKTGFYHSVTFRRVFKKYEGITSGQFREKAAGSN